IYCPIQRGLASPPEGGSRRPHAVRSADMQRFEGRVAVVTGCGGGICGAICRQFGREGARVAVLDRDETAAKVTAQAIVQAGGDAAAFACDITDRAAVDAAVAAVTGRIGETDVLVNHAGWDIFRPFLKTDPADW